MNSCKYVIISPVRDEAAHLDGTIRSMISQTVPPSEWIIVNDGSTDETGLIAARYAADHPWIRVLTLANRGSRKAGGGVVDAFNQGYQSIRTFDFDYLVKFDGDLSFDEDYFERCFARFQKDPKLGIGGGTICHEIAGVWEPEKQPRHHVRGATKIYRRACWEEIGGLIAAPGWDTVDEYRAMMAGWTTRSFDDIRLRHHRPTGQANGVWNGAIKDGIADYIAGFHPVFMVAKCLHRGLRTPFSLSALGLGWGFLTGYLSHSESRVDRDLIRFVRRQQMRRLLRCLRRRESL